MTNDVRWRFTKSISENRGGETRRKGEMTEQDGIRPPFAARLLLPMNSGTIKLDASLWLAYLLPLPTQSTECAEKEQADNEYMKFTK